MKKLIYFVLLIMLVSGCATASFSNTYGAIYNNALDNETSILIIKEGKFEKVKEITFNHLKSLGYNKVIYSKPNQGFLVFVKDIPVSKALLIGDPNSYLIIVKFTKAGVGKTRIDLVRGSNILVTNNEVDKDIQQIAELIENE